MTQPTIKKKLSPIQSIYFVEERTVTSFQASDIKKNQVGAKAWGLTCIPKSWTLPYIVISSEALKDAKSGQCLRRWGDSIRSAAEQAGLTDNIYIRSSAPSETMQAHGKYFSVKGKLQEVEENLKYYTDRLKADSDISNEVFPLIIQVYASQSHKGHLSNERRCYKEPRDWQGQFESKCAKPDFSINLRNWRETFELNQENTLKPLACSIQQNIVKALKLPAAWGYEFDKRLHFEWVWNGKNVFIVQAEEEEVDSNGFNPDALTIKPENVQSTDNLKVIAKIDRTHADSFAKIHNAFIYNDLNLGKIPLFILNDRSILENIANGLLSPSLENDLTILTSRSLVIRTDVCTEKQSDKQMLPRTNEVRSFEEARDWLIDSCQIVLESFPNNKIAFIFHNFIPSKTSAFALASPDERKVEIEALWGIPEGLYYNSHDKYIVDTKNSSLESAIQKQEFSIKKNVKFKSHCVSPDNTGAWISKKIAAPHDWKESINKDKWIKQVAIESRKIAEKEGKSVSIMWFIDVPDWATPDPVLPWFHEEYKKEKIPRAKNRRLKHSSDQHYSINTGDDLVRLEAMVKTQNCPVRQILVKPREDSLLRDKLTLKKIGDIAKGIEAVILLEGATLSHAYYQLQDTGAVISIENPFEEDIETREFNKLVRDRIPERINNGGESVQTHTLSSEGLIKALGEKLVEEATEVLDATDHDSILEEIGDVLEVIDALTKHLKADKDEILKFKEKKFEKLGGFDSGLVLLETSNPSPSSSPKQDQNFSLDLDEPSNTPLPEITTQTPVTIKKKTDKRTHGDSTESLLTIECSSTLDKWEAETTEIDISNIKTNSIKANLTGIRHGSKIRLELSIHSSTQQLDLLDNQNYEN